jgi:uncharacterized protein DUF3606
MNPTARLFVPAAADTGIEPRVGDDDRIDVTALHEIDRWTEALGVSEVQLRLAVAEVGVSAQDVRDHLGM